MKSSCTFSLVAVACLAIILAEVTHAASPRCVCNCPCTKEKDPVCATNGKVSREFPTRCVWQNYNCKHRTGKNAFPQVTPGPCP